jgi:hypothetical protein
MARSIAAVILLALVTAGCASGSQRAAATPAGASAAAGATPEVAGAGQPNPIRPLDRASLADVPGYAAFDVGQHHAQALSPDGRTLAVIAWSGGGIMKDVGTLHLIDLPSWADKATEVKFYSYVDQMVFRPDGRALFWAKHTSEEGSHGLPRNFQLYRFDVGTRVVSVVAKFPAAFVPWDMRHLRSRPQLALYGIPVGLDNIAEDVPHLLLVDTVRNRVTNDIRISGLTDGHHKIIPNPPDANPYREYSSGRAWDLDRDRLYIAHPAADRVTVIGLDSGTILAQSDAGRRLTFLNHLFNRLFLPAEAKMNPGNRRQAALSRDGSRLYIAGIQMVETRQANGTIAHRETPLGVDILDTHDLSKIRRLDLAVSEVLVSAAGQVLLTGTQLEAPGNGQLKSQGSGLFILDERRPERVAQLNPGERFLLEGFSRDGFYAYVGQWQTSGGVGIIYRVLDLRTQSFTAQRELRGYWNGLLAIVADR